MQSCSSDILLCEFHFLDFFSDTICEHNVQIIASNASVIGALRFEYRTLVRLYVTPTFSECIEDPKDNVKCCIADN